MKRLFLLLGTILPLSATVITDVRFKISAGDLISADAIAEDYCRVNGANSEYAAAVSWLARGALNMKDTDAALRYLLKAKDLVSGLVKSTRVEDDSFLTAAVGACIEVEARMLAAQGHRDQAVALLQAELTRWKTWPLQARIQKNLNMLTLEGKAAPQLDGRGRGKPTLLFLWAHWCGDCKAQAPVLAQIWKRYQSRGLLIEAPTRRYGSTTEIEHATAEQEDAEIERVWKETYAALVDVPHPVNEAVMSRYGVSSTPTLVLIDRKGMVRMYRPFRMSETELARQIDAVLE